MTVRKVIQIPGSPVAPYPGNTIGVQPGVDAGSIDDVDEPLSNVFYVDQAAAAGGNGSSSAPFNALSTAISACPAGGALRICPGDYSGEGQQTLLRDVSFVGLAGVVVGNRPKLPALRFNGCANFFAQNCELGLCTVSSAVAATLQSVDSSWADIGGLSSIRASSSPTPFGGPPQHSIAGTCGSATLQGMNVLGLNAMGSIVGYDCLSTVTGGGLVAANTIVLKNSELGALAIVTAPTIFLDQWSWFQVQEQGAVLSTAPFVQEISPLVYSWGILNAAAPPGFMNPWIKFGGIAASAAVEYIATPRPVVATTIHGQLASVLGFDVLLTLYQGATIGGLAPTALQMTITAGQLSGDFELVPGLAIPRGRFLAMHLQTGGGAAISNVATEAQVTLS